MASPRVLVVSGSAGHGHVMAAKALASALRRRHPTFDVAHLDAVERMAIWFRRTYRWGYVRLVDRHPHLWRMLYEQTNRKTSTLGHLLTVAGGRDFIRICSRWNPHVIVCTHFLAPELLSRAMRQGRIRADLQAVITDHDTHRAWYWPEVGRYYVASDLVKARLHLTYGVPEDRIRVTGIPIRRAFVRRHDEEGVRVRLGLDPRRPTVLFLSGGFAAGDMARAILGIWSDRRDVQVLAVCGRNERLRRRIAALPRPSGAQIHVFGFHENPAELMSVSEVVVAKSGGITSAEVPATGRPLLICNSIPGQEERNADVLVEAGAALRALTPEEVRWRVVQLLDDPARLKAMGRAARAFAKPRAAADIADLVAADLAEPAWTGPRFHGAR